MRQLESVVGTAGDDWDHLRPDDVDEARWAQIGDALRVMPRSVFAPFSGYLHTRATMRRDRPGKLVDCPTPVLTAAVAMFHPEIAGALAVGRQPLPDEWAHALAAMEKEGEAYGKILDAAQNRVCDLGLALGAAQLACENAKGTAGEAPARKRIEEVTAELAAAHAELTGLWHHQRLQGDSKGT